MLKCLKFNCFMLQSQKIKCLVLSRSPHSDPLLRLKPSTVTNFNPAMISKLHLKQRTYNCSEEGAIIFHSETGVSPVEDFKRNLRALIRKYRESADRSEITNFFLFGPKNPFGKLFSEMTLKGPVSFYFLQNLQKLKIRPYGLPRRP